MNSHHRRGYRCIDGCHEPCGVRENDIQMDIFPPPERPASFQDNSLTEDIRWVCPPLDSDDCCVTVALFTFAISSNASEGC